MGVIFKVMMFSCLGQKCVLALGVFLFGLGL